MSGDRSERGPVTNELSKKETKKYFTIKRLIDLDIWAINVHVRFVSF